MEIWRGTRQFELPFHLSHWIKDVFTCTAPAFPNTNVNLSLGFLWSLSNAAFTDGPQDCRDHGFDTSCLFNENNKQPNKTKHPCPPKNTSQTEKKPTTKQNHTKHIQPKPEKHSSFWKIYSVMQKVPIWGLFCWQNCKSWEGPWWEGNIVSPAPASPGFHCISCGPFRTSNQQFLPLPMAVFLRSTNINADAINMSVYISVSNSAMLIEWLSVHFIMH